MMNFFKRGIESLRQPDRNPYVRKTTRPYNRKEKY